VFSELDDFQAALRGGGVLGMLVTGGGPFRAANPDRAAPPALVGQTQMQGSLVPMRWIELPKAPGTLLRTLSFS
jgi:hypothetical protein